MRKTYTFPILTGLFLAATGLMAQPANDLICDATSLMPLGTVVAATNAGATATGSPAVPAGTCWSDGGGVGANTNDVWFSFVAPAQTSGIMRITTTAGANDDTQMQVWRATPPGSCTGTLTVVPGGCNDDIAASNWMSEVNISMTALVAGETYFVQVDGWGGTVGSFSIVANYLNPPPPLNYPTVLSSSILTTYTDLGTTGSAVSLANTDNATSAPINIGFNFSYNNSTYSDLRINTNGFIKLGSVAPSADTLFRKYPDGLVNTAEDIPGALLRTIAADTNMIVPFNTDLIGNAGAEIRVTVQGTAPNRICVIQWKDFKDKPKRMTPCPGGPTGGNCTAGALPAITMPDSLVPSFYNSIEFQVKLYEGTNNIDFVYGTFVLNPAITNILVFRSYEVGLKGRGTSSSDLNIVSKTSNGLWSSGVSFVTSTTQNIFNSRIAGASPGASGRTFRFPQIPQNDAGVGVIMATGKHPIPSGNPTRTYVVITNTGLDLQANLSVTLTVTGANPGTQTIQIPSLASLASTIVTFDTISLTNVGIDSLVVTVPNDNFLENNSRLFVRTVNNSTYGYAWNTLAPSGVVYNPLPVAYLQRYPIKDSALITKVRAFILNDQASVGNTVSAYVANSAGTILGEGPNIVLGSSDLNNWLEFPIGYQSFPPPSFSNSDVYIAFVQTPNINPGNYFPLSYQLELPPRPGTAINYVAAPGGTPSATPSASGYRWLLEAEIADPNAPNLLSAFNLSTPPNHTLVNLQGPAATTANIRWTKSTDGGGLPVSYVWLADLQGGSFNPPLLQYSANNGGADTVLTLTYEQIDDALALAGIPVDCTSPIDLSWTVIAVAGANSRWASDTFDISFARCGLQYVLCTPNSTLNTNDFIDSTAINGDAGTFIRIKDGRNLPNQYRNYYDSAQYWLNIGTKGVNYPFTLRMGFSPFPYQGYAFIDFDHNNRFDEANGVFVTNAMRGDTIIQTPAVLTGNINIPANIPDGVYRMRIIAGDTDGTLQPCVVQYGDVDDYRIYVGPFGIGMDPESSASVNMYPNPARELVTLAYSFEKNTDLAVQLMNSVGQQLVRRELTNTREGRIDLSLEGLKPGMYFTRITSDGQVKTLKLIVE